MKKIGFSDRFRHEIKELVPKTIRTKVTAERNRNYSAWIGGCMLSQLNTFQLVSKCDYEEIGSRIITKLFPN